MLCTKLNSANLKMTEKAAKRFLSVMTVSETAYATHLSVAKARSIMRMLRWENPLL